MLRRLIPVLSLCVLAVTALLAVTSEASADRASRQARRGSRGGILNRQRGVYPQQQMVQQQSGAEEQEMGVQTQQQRTLGYRSYYRVPTPDAPAGTVLLNVQVPANAKVWIDGNPTEQTGIARQFVSPPLANGRQFTYEIKSRWTEDGREVVRTRRVPVQAGQAVVINLLQPTQEELRQNTNRKEEERRD